MQADYASQPPSSFPDKRLLLTAALCICIILTFWLSSRYPALNEKAAMGGSTVLQDQLSFDAVYIIDPSDSFFTKVAYTTLNWINTNKKGMTLGVLLAAGIMTLLPLFQALKGAKGLRGSIFGVLMGTPLGVCVNCAAPIACGLRASGAKVETTLAAMISSPTLNIVVLTMLFALLPFHLALMKVILTFVVLLVLIPVVSSLYANNLVDISEKFESRYGKWGSKDFFDVAPLESAGWYSAFKWLVIHYGKNLWFVVRYTVPLMLLAGFLGALLMTILPWDVLVDALPVTGASRLALAILIVASIGLFLPVPIAFDVVVVATLYAGGLPDGYAMALLFTLGIFSVYSYFVVAKFISLRLASAISVGLISLGVAAGLSAHWYEQWDLQRQERLITESFWNSTAPVPDNGPGLPSGIDDNEVLSRLSANAVIWTPDSRHGVDGIDVEYFDYKPRSPSGGTQFERHYGEKYGLVRTNPFGRRLSLGHRSIAAGDVHGDGWDDLLIATQDGPILFANSAGNAFVEQRIDIPLLKSLDIGLAALVDLNNDGWLDIFLSAYRQGNHVVYNNNGRFSENGYERLPDTGANILKAAAFGDLDQDGDLDAVYGSWTAGVRTRNGLEKSRNALLWNERGRYSIEMLPGVPGETLSVLISDINMDNKPDVVVGNDFAVPDIVYLGYAKGRLRMLGRDDQFFPYTTESTMSVDAADIDNDLAPDLYIGQVTGGVPGQRARQLFVSRRDVCNEHTDVTWKRRCFDSVSIREIFLKKDVFHCAEIKDATVREYCLARVLLGHTTRKNSNPEDCDMFPDRWRSFALMCRDILASRGNKKQELSRKGIRQLGNSKNVMFMMKKAHLKDMAPELGLDVGGWTWNAKFADLDNDGWQDIYIANGTILREQLESNMFFSNQGGRGFTDKTVETGLKSMFPTGSYAYVDFDNDGDLDIFVEAPDSPVWVFENGLNHGNSISLELRDERGNIFGVGSKITIFFGSDQKQMRVIKASGGYLSYDPLVAHFGLGEHDFINRIEISWSNGGNTVLEGNFKAGRRYRISRSKSGAS